MAAPVEFLRRQGTLAGEGTIAGSAGEGGSQPASHLRELSVLFDRLGPFLTSMGASALNAPLPSNLPPGTAAPLPAPGARSTAEGAAAAAAAGAALVGGAGSAALAGATAERRDVLLSQILSVAAMAARTDAELRGALDKLRSLGVNMPTSKSFGRSAARSPRGRSRRRRRPSNRRSRRRSALRRRRCAVSSRCPRIPRKSAGASARWWPSPSSSSIRGPSRGRRGCSTSRTRSSPKTRSIPSAENARRRAQESVDLERVRSLGEDARNHETLTRILSFFPAFTTASLIGELQGEEKRDRRRLLLSLLEIHGAEARATALSLLVAAKRSNPAHDWHFKRNLLYLLRRIPRGTEDPSDSELDVLILLANPSLPPPLVKEAIAGLGGAHHERSEAALISIVHGLETMLAKKATLHSTRPSFSRSSTARSRRSPDSEARPRAASSSSTASAEKEDSATPRHVSRSSPARTFPTIPSSSRSSSRASRPSCRSRCSASPSRSATTRSARSSTPSRRRLCPRYARRSRTSSSATREPSSPRPPHAPSPRSTHRGWTRTRRERA